MAHGQRYEALVSAKTSDEAIEIASEAIPPQKRVLRASAEDVSAVEGPDSWQVTLWFEGGGRGGEGGES